MSPSAESVVRKLATGSCFGRATEQEYCRQVQWKCVGKANDLKSVPKRTNKSVSSEQQSASIEKKSAGESRAATEWQSARESLRRKRRRFTLENVRRVAEAWTPHCPRIYTLR